jgi:hypothetical protein
LGGEPAVEPARAQPGRPLGGGEAEQERPCDVRGEVVEETEGPGEDEREMGAELLDEHDPVAHQLLARPDGRLQRHRRRRVRLEYPEPVTVGAQGVGQDIRVSAVVLVAGQAVAGAQRLHLPAGDDHDRDPRPEQGVDDRAIGALDGDAVDTLETADELAEPDGRVFHLEPGHRDAPLVDHAHRVAVLRPVDAGGPADTIHACLLAVAAAWGHPAVMGRVRRSLTDRRSMAHSPIAARHVPARRSPRYSCRPSSGEKRWRWSDGHRVHRRVAPVDTWMVPQ